MLNEDRKLVLRRIVIYVSAFIITCGIIFFLMMKQEEKAISNLTYQEINMNEIEDGTYSGRCYTTFIKVEVEVTVKNHVIQDIKLLKHENGLGNKAENMIPEMIKNNTYDVDTISGATGSSKIIRKAVNNALKTAN